MIRVDILKLMFREYGRRCGCHVSLNNQKPVSRVKPLRLWNLFTVHSFFSSPSSSFFSFRSRPSPHPFLQMRLDEDRPVFINHPLKRNPWRSIINDFATNFEEVPRPNVIRSVECILHFEIRARLTRNRRPDSLTSGFFFLSVANVAPWYVYTCTLTLKFECNHQKIYAFVAREIIRNLKKRFYLYNNMSFKKYVILIVTKTWQTICENIFASIEITYVA